MSAASPTERSLVVATIEISIAFDQPVAVLQGEVERSSMEGALRVIETW
jgi:hypothetical protein